jgi:hypothetical protein
LLRGGLEISKTYKTEGSDNVADNLHIHGSPSSCAHFGPMILCKGKGGRQQFEQVHGPLLLLWRPKKQKKERRRIQNGVDEYADAIERRWIGLRDKVGVSALPSSCETDQCTCQFCLSL